MPFISAQQHRASECNDVGHCDTIVLVLARYEEKLQEKGPQHKTLAKQQTFSNG